MGDAFFDGVDSEIEALKAGIREFEEQACAVVRDAAVVAVKALHVGTPVWSGETVRNYVPVIGGGPGGGSKPAAGTGDPGPTNDMSLGEEPRRAANEAASIADTESVMAGYKSLDKSVVITNTVSEEKWSIVDSGSAPTPERARYPGGVGILGEQRARASLKDFE